MARQGAARLSKSSFATVRGREGESMNRMEEFAGVFDGLPPWDGEVPKGYLVDFTGALTDARFRTMFGVDPDSVGGGHVQTRLPTIEDGEGWFEAGDWVLAAREAGDRFVMITLGACYGAHAVSRHRQLPQLHPNLCTLHVV